jgi:hypothetical protein
VTPVTAPAKAMLSLTEVWEQLQPHGDIFAAAEWLNVRLRLAKVHLLGDGELMAPAAFPSMLTIKPFVAVDGRAWLKVESLVSFTRDYKDWTIARESFEAQLLADDRTRLSEKKRARLSEKKHKGGRPREYSREEIFAEAFVYVGVYSCPNTMDGEGGLIEKLELQLKGKRLPRRSQLSDILRPYFNRIQAERGKKQ